MAPQNETPALAGTGARCDRLVASRSAFNIGSRLIAQANVPSIIARHLRASDLLQGGAHG